MKSTKATDYINEILHIQKIKKQETGSEAVFDKWEDADTAAIPEPLNSAIAKVYKRIPKEAVSLKCFVRTMMKCAYKYSTYYVWLGDRIFLDLCAYHYLDIGQLAVYLEAAMELGIFDREKYERFSVLTSVDMQKLFLDTDGYNNEEEEIEYRYWLIDVE